ncbi:hypothetical protein ES703_61659 [subsurface metagenome]
MAKVAWYDIKGHGWFRDIVVLLHIPYTAWHLSYIAIGAALAPVMNWVTLGWTVLAFFLGMGICAHCADELKGRPLRTTIPSWILALLGGAALGGAAVIGLTVGLEETVWIFPCVIFGVFIVFAYNLELFRGFFHTNFWFGFAWGAFPALTAYIAQTHTISLEIVFVAGACLLYSVAQRVLSLQARFFRRKVEGLEGRYYLEGKGPVKHGEILTKQVIIEPAEVALKFMTWTVVAAAMGLLLMSM